MSAQIKLQGSHTHVPGLAEPFAHTYVPSVHQRKMARHCEGGEVSGASVLGQGEGCVSGSVPGLDFHGWYLPFPVSAISALEGYCWPGDQDAKEEHMAF